MNDIDEMQYFHDVGESLVEFSTHSERSGRGMITELFPYIFVAARRLSTRAISDYLREHHQAKLSASSVAKALREPEKHLRGLGEKFEAAASTVARAHSTSWISILGIPELATFEAITSGPTVLWH